MHRAKYLLPVFFLLVATIPGSSSNQRPILPPGIMPAARDDNFDVPDETGAVSLLPWDQDEDFLRAKEGCQTPILMVGFCAVLKNPLPCEEYNVGLATESVKGILVPPTQVFSMNASIGPYSGAQGYQEGASYIGGKIIMTEGGGVCKIASVLYNLAVLANVDVIERHNHSMPTNYVSYGQDATVAYGVKDLKFKNTTSGNILIWARLIGYRLYMAFYGADTPPKVTWSHEVSNLVKPPLKYIKNPELPPGEMKTVIKGIDGARVKTTVTIEYGDGRIETKNMGISYYSPLPEVVEVN